MCPQGLPEGAGPGGAGRDSIPAPEAPRRHEPRSLAVPSQPQASRPRRGIRGLGHETAAPPGVGQPGVGPPQALSPAARIRSLPATSQGPEHSFPLLDAPSAERVGKPTVSARPRVARGLPPGPQAPRSADGWLRWSFVDAPHRGRAASGAASPQPRGRIESQSRPKPHRDATGPRVSHCQNAD